LTDSVSYCPLLCSHLVDSIDFKTEQHMIKQCGCDTFNVIEKQGKFYLRCAICEEETEINIKSMEENGKGGT
jgi:hypothetical protein